MIRAARSTLAGIVLCAALIGVAAYGLAALITVLDIAGRRLGWAVPGVVDLVQLCTLGGAWLVIPYAFWTGGHVRVDLFVGLLPAGLVALAGAVAALLGLLLLAPMTWQAFAAFQLQRMFGDRSQQLGLPMTWYWLPLLTGLALSIAVNLWLVIDPEPERERA